MPHLNRGIRGKNFLTEGGSRGLKILLRGFVTGNGRVIGVKVVDPEIGVILFPGGGKRRS